jgi:hypothetical protein
MAPSLNRPQIRYILIKRDTSDGKCSEKKEEGMELQIKFLETKRELEIR